MVNPGAFKGARRAFLMDQKPLYADSVRKDQAGDMIVDIQRRFFKRFPIDKGIDFEPTEEELQAVEDDAEDPEPDVPDEDELSSDDYAKAMKDFEARKATVMFQRQVSVTCRDSSHVCLPSTSTSKLNVGWSINTAKTTRLFRRNLCWIIRSPAWWHSSLKSLRQNPVYA